MTFAEKVYDAVSRIPKGRVATYGQIAEIIGCPGGSRAVGNALHINPFAPIDSPDLSTAPAGAATPDGPTALAAAPDGPSRVAAPAPAGPSRVAAPSPADPSRVAAAPAGPAATARRVVPCHRVVAADGSLAAHFGGGGPAVQYSRLLPEGVIFHPAPPSQSIAPAPAGQVPAPAAQVLAPVPAGQILAPAAQSNAPVPAAQVLAPAPAFTPQHPSGTSSQTAPAPIPRVDLSRSGIVIERHPLEPFLPRGACILFLGSFPPPCARWSMDFFYPNWINDFWRIQGLIHFGDPQYFEYKSEISSPATPEPACPEPACPEAAAMLAGPAPAAPNAPTAATATTAATAADAAAPNSPTAAANPAVRRVSPKRFDRARIIEFCTSHGLAFYDTASKVCRWKGNASDEFLEILEPADIVGMLTQMPDCHTIVSTGGKSAEELAGILVASGATLSSGSSRVATAITPPPIGSYLDLLLAGRPLRWWRMPSTSRAYPMPLAAKAALYAQLFR